MEGQYNQILKELQASFPTGAITKGERAFIPVQAYIVRLETVAKGCWEWRVNDFPSIDIANKVVMVIGELSILGTKRQGVGVAQLQGNGPMHIKNAVSIAESESLRNACDKFLMGWKDLAPYREWGENIVVKEFLTDTSEQNNKSIIKDFDENVHSNVTFLNQTGDNERMCIKCSKVLTPAEALYLSRLTIRKDYCPDCLPKQFKKT